MGKIETIFFWIAAYTFTVAFLVQLAAIIFKKESWVAPGWYLTLIAFGFLTATVATRWIGSGHPPVDGRYESNLAGAWFVLLMLVLVQRWFKRIKVFGLLIIPIVLIMLGQGIMSRPELRPLTPNYNSWWLWIHVLFAWFAYGSFAVASGLGLIYLLKNRAVNSDAKFWGLFPDVNLMDDIITRFVFFGFISQTMMLISGSIWANGLWGRYWGWDPLETWSLVTWLTYGVIIHFRLTLGWKGTRIAWLVLMALATEIVTLFGIGYVTALHTPLL